MKTHKSITNELVLDLVRRDENQGICVYCGYIQDSVEPDAEKYRCDDCGEWGVYGAEQLLLIL